MSLFDGQPLTEHEVAQREVCECDHYRGTHRGGTNCTMCPCEEFVARADAQTYVAPQHP